MSSQHKEELEARLREGLVCSENWDHIFAHSEWRYCPYDGARLLRNSEEKRPADEDSEALLTHLWSNYQEARTDKQAVQERLEEADKRQRCAWIAFRRTIARYLLNGESPDHLDQIVRRIASGMEQDAVHDVKQELRLRYLL